MKKRIVRPLQISLLVRQQKVHCCCHRSSQSTVPRIQSVSSQAYIIFIRSFCNIIFSLTPPQNSLSAPRHFSHRYPQSIFTTDERVRISLPRTKTSALTPYVSTLWNLNRRLRIYIFIYLFKNRDLYAFIDVKKPKKILYYGIVYFSGTYVTIFQFIITKLNYFAFLLPFILYRVRRN